jgi:hypothetical protein
MDVEQRIATTAPLLHEHEAVTGWAALRWLGGRWFTGNGGDGSPVAIPVAVRRHLWAQEGFVFTQEFLRPAHLHLVDGLQVASAIWAACFAARYAPTPAAAVQVLDMAAYSDLVSAAEIAALTARLNAWTGVPQLRKAVQRMDENAWSPQETRMRLIWQDSRLGWPRCNHPVFDLDGRHLGTPDLIDPAAGIVGEYDGALHLAGSQRWRDLERESRFRSAGLEVVTMVAGDFPVPSAFLGRLHAAYHHAATAGRRPGWTLEVPDWWTTTHTVARRRSLDDEERRRLLAYRAA